MNMNSVEGFNTDNEVKNSSYLNTLDKSELLKVTITDVVQGFCFLSCYQKTLFDHFNCFTLKFGFIQITITSTSKLIFSNTCI